MLIRSILALALSASSAIANVNVCTLHPTEKHLLPSFAVYEHEGVIHSATLEYMTEYGDSLPYLFVCGTNCVMDMAGDNYRYIISVEPNLRSPELVTLVTESKNDEFRTVETLRVSACKLR